jgi:L-fucose isomerase-like protein
MPLALDLVPGVALGPFVLGAQVRRAALCLGKRSCALLTSTGTPVGEALALAAERPEDYARVVVKFAEAARTRRLPASPHSRR